jgi:hypothetical protein
LGGCDSNTRRKEWLADAWRLLLTEWSGIRESNPRLDLGKVAYYHYTNPAYGATSRQAFIYSMAV